MILPNSHRELCPERTAVRDLKSVNPREAATGVTHSYYICIIDTVNPVIYDIVRQC